MEIKVYKSDWWLIVLFQLVAIPLNLLDYGDYTEKWKLFAEVFGFAVVSTFSAVITVFVLFRYYFPRKAYLKLFLLTGAFLLVMGFVDMQYHCLLYECKDKPWSIKSIYYGFLYLTDGLGILVSALLGKKIYDAQLKYMEMESHKRESELRMLKAQVNPHFLFNNLNTVDALIDNNPKMAKTYLNKLAHLYRYLIENTDAEVVPLDEEWLFAKDYLFLLECRYGKAYQFLLPHQKEAFSAYYIPPGALQTILENVVKHNVGSDEEPVCTHISIDDQAISISNDINKRPFTAQSTGTGLANLKARYKHLTDRPVFWKSNGQFSVTIPLIEKVE